MKCQTLFSWEIYEKIQLSVKFAKRLLKLNIQGKVKKKKSLTYFWVRSISSFSM